MTPDALIRWYYESADAGAPALDLVDSRGRVYGPRCLACPSTIRHSTREALYVCGRCGADWPYEDRFILKGAVSRAAKVRGDRVSNVPSPSPGGSERRISRRVDVGVLLAAFLRDGPWRVRARFYVANALGFSIRRLADEAPHAWRLPGPVSRYMVGEMVAQARVEWTTRLQVAGLVGKV